MNKKIKTIDLFAGVGGIRWGLVSTVFETKYTNDNDKFCQKTYDLNFRTAKLDVRDIDQAIEDGVVPGFDFLLAGFPCQAFSIAGRRLGFEDPRGRGNLFFSIAKILHNADPQPAGFLLENVKNLRGHDGGKTFDTIMQTLTSLGFHVGEKTVKVMNSMDYGNIPQNRERIYIVGFKDKKHYDKFEFPKPIKLKRNFRDLLEEDVDEKYYYNDKALYAKLKKEVISYDTVYQWRRVYVRGNKKGVCPTLTANMGMGGHNVPIIRDKKGIRKLTPRECFNLQGFPRKAYKLPKRLSDAALYKQAGNSVTVPVIRRIARQIKNAIEN